MPLPPVAFYAIYEIAVRWGCHPADVAGWAAAGHLQVLAGIAPVSCGEETVAGMIDAMRERLSRDPDPMTLRRRTVEHPFGTIKGWMGSTHFLTRRLKNVRTERTLNVLAYNIKRMIALVGIRGLMEAIPG